MPQIKRILIPTDFSYPSDLAVEYAIDLARRYGATIHVLHVIEDVNFTSVYPDGFFAELPTLRAQLMSQAQNRIADTASRCAEANVTVTTQVTDGRATRVISEIAALRGIELIVMGTHGRGGVAHMVMGSVAERVVRTAPCPVFTVRDTTRVADAITASAVKEATALPA